jgi:hypothetical protein
MRLSEELQEAASEDIVARVVRWIQDNGDSDLSPEACFSVSTTDEVANGLKIDAKVAYDALAMAAKKKVFNMKRRDLRKSASGGGAYSSKDKAVGWRAWEVSLRPEQCE